MPASILKRQLLANFSKSFCLSGAALLLFPMSSLAQTADTTTDTPSAPSQETAEPEDEVIATGTHIVGHHEGMDAFFRGDFETAEIEFENEFKALRRFNSARENAVLDAQISAERAQSQGEASNNQGSTINSPGGGASIQSAGAALSTAPSISTNFSNRRSEGQTVLTDGETTYEDFAFSRYMAGLSEIKLGKYDEAKSSLKSSLFYDENNFDAQMRIGLLYLLEDDFESAADHLEKLDRLRRRCEKRDCPDEKQITDATLILANEINEAVAKISN